MLHLILTLNTITILKKKVLNVNLVIMSKISQYKNVFGKGYTQNWSEEVYTVSKIKDAVPWTYVISDLNDESITESVYKKELQKTDQEKFWIEKVTRRKCYKLYVKWKGYDNSFNSMISKKNLV